MVTVVAHPPSLRRAPSPGGLGLMPDPHHNANEVGAEASRAPRAVIVFLLVGAAIAGAILALREVSGSNPCSGTLILSVEVAPEVAAAIQSAAAEYQKTEPSLDG